MGVNFLLSLANDPFAPYGAFAEPSRAIRLKLSHATGEFVVHPVDVLSPVRLRMEQAGRWPLQFDQNREARICLSTREDVAKLRASARDLYPAVIGLVLDGGQELVRKAKAETPAIAAEESLPVALRSLVPLKLAPKLFERVRTRHPGF